MTHIETETGGLVSIEPREIEGQTWVRLTVNHPIGGGSVFLNPAEIERIIEALALSRPTASGGTEAERAALVIARRMVKAYNKPDGRETFWQEFWALATALETLAAPADTRGAGVGEEGARPPYAFQSTCGVCGIAIGGDGDVCNRCAAR